MHVYLNGELLHTGMLEHVPYLYPCKGSLLPEDAGRYIHVGMTSSDVLDTGLALQLKQSILGKLAT